MLTARFYTSPLHISNHLLENRALSLQKWDVCCIVHFHYSVYLKTHYELQAIKLKNSYE